MTTMVDQLLLTLDRQCRLNPDGYTSMVALAHELYGGVSASELRAVTQLIYRARKLGMTIEAERASPRAAARFRRGSY